MEKGYHNNQKLHVHEESFQKAMPYDLNQIKLPNNSIILNKRLSCSQFIVRQKNIYLSYIAV